MNKLTIQKGNEKYEIYVDNYKIIFGSNYNMKFDILRTILRISNNLKPSEFAEENNNIAQLYINDKSLKSKDVFIYNVHKDYSFTDDFKMTSKSLVLKYFETLLSDNEFFDTINTLNILYESLSDEILSMSSLTGQFNAMVPKQLIKLLTPQYIFDDFSKDEYDLSLEEIIVFQLTLIKYILDNDKTIQHSIICIELPVLTSTVLKYIKEIKNCLMLIFTQDVVSVDEDISKYFICEKNFLDVASEEQLFDIICDNDFAFLTLEEGREYMNSYLHKEDNDQARFVVKLLNI